MVTAWGTTSSALTQVILYYFNPRSRVGNDEVKEAIQTTSQISIHVPAWGTTHVQRLRPVNYAVFQSTFPRGERRRETKKAMFGWAFQSTFPRGERRSLSCIFIHDELFQSTFPRGERLRYGSIDGNSIKFQSTFPRGERQNVCRLFLIFCHFNPRSRVGNDMLQVVFLQCHYEFQSTFPRGERRSNLPAPVSYTNFNPRSRVGNDDGGATTYPPFPHFNPRSRVGNDPVCRAKY